MTRNQFSRESYIHSPLLQHVMGQDAPNAEIAAADSSLGFMEEAMLRNTNARALTIIALAVLAFAANATAEELNYTPIPNYSDAVRQLAQIQGGSVQGCCAIRNNSSGANFFDWSDGVTREDCVRTANAAGMKGTRDWFHYPNESCASVKKRCSPAPCP